MTYPSGTGLTTQYGYFVNSGDQRLQTIQNKKGSTQLSKFDYTYNGDGTLATWITQTGTATAITHTLTYDAVDQLVSDVQSGGGSVSDAFNYDPAGNRLTETLSGTTTGGRFNSVNQLMALGTTSGTTTVSGTTTSAATSVTINGLNATVTGSTSFSLGVPTLTGTNIYSITAQPTPAGTAVTKLFQSTVGGTVTSSALTYDADGNMTTDEQGNTYKWDACNRLTAIIYGSLALHPGTHSEFSYDGLGRRVALLDRAGTTIGSGTAANSSTFLWAGSEIAEVRGSTGTAVLRRLFAQGEQDSSTNFYYMRDHLGSLREFCDYSGALKTRYSYDAYGRVTTTYVSGTHDAFYLYAGMQEHLYSGLNLTKYRFYDPNTGRWISFDPIAENGGINLYGYVANNPINKIDPLGLNPGDWLPSSGGVQVSGSADAGTITPGGYVAGGGTITWGGGFFEDTSNGNFSGGMFISAGAFLRIPHGPNGSLPPSGGMGSQCPYSVGGNAGMGPGVWFSNAGNVSDLNGPFNQYNLNLFGINIALGLSSDAKGNITYIAGISTPNAGLAQSGYPTNTVSTNPGGTGTSPRP